MDGAGMALWVIHVISSEQKRLPLFPQEPTFGCSTISVAEGQIRKSPVARLNIPVTAYTFATA